MLRSRIARTNSKLEIFTDIVDCRQKQNPYHFQNLFYLICISHFFITFVFPLPMMPCAERLIFFMEFGFLQGFEVSNSNT